MGGFAGVSALEEWEPPSVAPLWGELRYGGELARLIAGEALGGTAASRRRVSSRRRCC